MKLLTRECESSEFLLRDHAAFRIGLGVEFRLNRKAFLRGGVAEEFHDDLPARQRHGSPVGGDVAEHPVFDLVPLARPGRIVGDRDQEMRLIRQLLQLQLEEPAAARITPSTVGGDIELGGVGVAFSSDPMPPAPDCLHGEFGRILVDAHRDESPVLRDVVDTVGDGLAELLVDEVMDFHLARGALRRPLFSPILVVPDEFFLLRIDRNHRSSAVLERARGLMDVEELRVAIRMRRSLLRLTIALETVLLQVQFLRHGRVADGVPFGREFPG